MSELSPRRRSSLALTTKATGARLSVLWAASLVKVPVGLVPEAVAGRCGRAAALPGRRLLKTAPSCPALSCRRPDIPAADVGFAVQPAPDVAARLGETVQFELEPGRPPSARRAETPWRGPIAGDLYT